MFVIYYGPDDSYRSSLMYTPGGIGAEYTFYSFYFNTVRKILLPSYLVKELIKR